MVGKVHRSSTWVKVQIRIIKYYSIKIKSTNYVVAKRAKDGFLQCSQWGSRKQEFQMSKLDFIIRIMKPRWQARNIWIFVCPLTLYSLDGNRGPRAPPGFFYATWFFFILKVSIFRICQVPSWNNVPKASFLTLCCTRPEPEKSKKLYRKWHNIWSKQHTDTN